MTGNDNRDLWRTDWHSRPSVRKMPAGWAERVRAELAERRRLREERETQRREVSS